MCIRTLRTVEDLRAFRGVAIVSETEALAVSDDRITSIRYAPPPDRMSISNACAGKPLSPELERLAHVS